MVNGDNQWIRRWSGVRVKLLLPGEGTRTRKKNEVQRRRNGRTGEPWKFESAASTAFGQIQTFLHNNSSLIVLLSGNSHGTVIIIVSSINLQQSYYLAEKAMMKSKRRVEHML